MNPILKALTIIASIGTVVTIIGGGIVFALDVKQTAEAAMNAVQFLEYQLMDERINTVGWDNLSKKEQAKFCQYVASLNLRHDRCGNG
jgi:hypothetical protein